MSEKLNIYFLLANIKVPTPIGGDKINEILLMKSFAKFANVYYNDQLINVNAKDMGIKSADIKLPKRKYDLYYVRNNKQIFMKLPHPKVYLGSPYDEDCFKVADAIITFTESWHHKLLNFAAHPTPGLYTGKIVIPRNIITFHQSYDPQFRSGLKNSKNTLEIRKNWGGDFIIGHFGRVAKSCYPYSLLKILPQLKATFPNKKINTVFCGLKSHWHEDIDSPHIKIKPPLSRSQMPYALSACDVVLCNYRTDTANWGGCRRVIEAMACGVPVLCGDFDVRKEQLGCDYPLFWTYEQNKGRISKKAENQMLSHLIKMINEPEWAEQIGKQMIERAPFYTIEENAKRIHRDLTNFMNKYKNETAVAKAAVAKATVAKKKPMEKEKKKPVVVEKKPIVETKKPVVEKKKPVVSEAHHQKAQGGYGGKGTRPQQGGYGGKGTRPPLDQKRNAAIKRADDRRKKALDLRKAKEKRMLDKIKIINKNKPQILLKTKK